VAAPSSSRQVLSWWQAWWPCWQAAPASGPFGQQELVIRLLRAKEKSGKTFDQLAEALGYTNVYTAALFYNQAPLDSKKAQKLKELVPDLTDDVITAMQKIPPLRTFDPKQFQDPTIYRLLEAVNTHGLGIKTLINEQFGDGIMSAIDFFSSVEKIKGTQGEDRVLITFNGKFLPYKVQNTKDNTAPRAKL